MEQQQRLPHSETTMKDQSRHRRTATPQAAAEGVTCSQHQGLVSALTGPLSAHREAELPVVREKRNCLCELLRVPKPQLVSKVKYGNGLLGGFRETTVLLRGSTTAPASSCAQQQLREHPGAHPEERLSSRQGTWKC